MLDVLSVYGVYCSADRTEGRGPSVHTGLCFRSKSEAQKYVRSQDYANRYGVMGTTGSDFDVRAMVLYIMDTVEDLNASRKEEARQKALAKLTEEDKQALGLI